MNRLFKAAVLSFFFTVCATAAVVTHRIHAYPAAPAPRDLFAVVSDQLSAIRHANFATAYRHATSDVQQKFTLPQFEGMLRRQYAQLGRSGRIEFGRVDIDAGTASVDVLVMGDDGAIESFEFALVAEGDAWKVGGVRRLQQAARGQGVVGIRL